MREILPGVFHWETDHPRIGIRVSSYYLADEGVLIDPFVPEAGLDALPRPPVEVLLTNRHHYRGSGDFVERFGCRVRCSEHGLGEFSEGEAVEPFSFGDRLAGGIEAFEVGAICPDETALVIPKGAGLVAVADGVIREGEGPLSFVPEEFMGADPEGVRAGLRAAYGRLLERSFDHLLLAHGQPWIGGGKEGLRAFVEG